MLIVAGLPASGKSTLARRFGRVLEFDDIAERFGLYGGGGDEEREIVSRQFALLAASGLYDAVVDVFPSRESRRRILEACPGAGIVIVQAPLEACLRRNLKRRKSWLSNDELVSISLQCEPVSIEEGFRCIEYIDNSKELSMASKVWLKIINGEVQAFGDEESLNATTGGAYDLIISPQKWDAVGNMAHVENGAIVFGDPVQIAYERNAEIIRNERYLRLRQCDKISPMRWNAMTEEQRQAWTDYRQALLDVPQQPGFPWNGNVEFAPWPKQPE